METEAIFNDYIKPKCIGCRIAQVNDFAENIIYKSKLWSVFQDVDIAYPGLIVLAPNRHVYSFAGLEEEEHRELFYLMLKVKEALFLIFHCDDFLYTVHETPGQHLYFKIIPIHGLIKLKDDTISLSEKAKDKLRSNIKNMEIIDVTIDKMRHFFSLIKAPF